MATWLPITTSLPSGSGTNFPTRTRGGVERLLRVSSAESTPKTSGERVNGIDVGLSDTGNITIGATSATPGTLLRAASCSPPTRAPRDMPVPMSPPVPLTVI